jgi:CheY-like chemotaxis protein
MRIVAVSGWGQADDRRRSFASGIDMHLVKPVDFEQLLRAVGSHVPSDRREH